MAMPQTPKRFTADEYNQMIRKNGNKVFNANWNLFDFVFGGKKADIIRAKFQETYHDNAAQEIQIENDKIQLAINNRVENGWLKIFEKE